MKALTIWIVSVLSVLATAAMCQQHPVVPVSDAGPPPSVIVDAGPKPAPSVTVDAGPTPSPIVDAGPAPAEPDWLECSPEGFKAEPGVKHKLGARMTARPLTMHIGPTLGIAKRSTFFEALNVVPLDQDIPKPLGACTGFSADECLSTVTFGVKSTQQRGLDLYHWATVLDGFVGTYPPDDTGSTCEAAAQAAMKLGLISGYDLAYTLADVNERLSLGPGVICSNWSTPEFTPDRCGLTHYDPNLIEGGHARALVGQSVLLKRFAERNTWGKKYGTTRKGVPGYFQQSFDDVQRQLDDGGVVVFYRLP